MGKPKNGPHWDDVYAFASALEQHSGGSVTVELRPQRNAIQEKWLVSTSLLVRTGPMPTDAVVLRSDGIWPNANFAELTGEALSQLYELDRELARLWKQMDLPMP